MTEDRSWTPIELSPGHAPPAGAFSPAVEAAGLVFVSDISHWGAVNKIFQEYFRPPFPARAVVGAALEGFLIEVAAVAVRPRPPEALR
jgi:enamine deaminase RidA (YjgF/YER057c/UK114 family)